MGYHLKAFVADVDLLKRHTAGLGKFKVIALGQNMALMPITKAVYRSFPRKRPINELAQEVKGIPHELAAWAEVVAADGPIAYLEASFSAGLGGQTAIVWSSNGIWFASGDYAWPDSEISQALRRIGVLRSDGQDEFDTLGLGKYRDTGDWLD